MSESPRVQLINQTLIQQTLERARQSPRLRTNFNFHGDDMEANPHRFLNVMLRDTYITPHRHLLPPKSESFLIIEGRVAFFTFAEDGQILRCDVLAGPAQAAGAVVNCGIDIAPGIWHTLVVLDEYAICFEVKPGPYRPADDKEFATWAPREGQAAPEETAAYLQTLRDHFHNQQDKPHV